MTAIAVPPSAITSGISTAIAAIFISNASIFLPRYSGVRPIIKPATNTATMAKISMPYSPEPTPPKITSPSCISHIGTRPPSGVNESCIALTEPLEAAVVAVAHSAELAMPKRVSLPSMLAPACSALGVSGRRRAACSAGLPACSAPTHSASSTTNTASSRREWPSPGACRRPSCRTCSTAPPGSAGSPAPRGNWTAASGSRTDAPS